MSRSVGSYTATVEICRFNSVGTGKDNAPEERVLVLIIDQTKPQENI